jgi:hypothetical protein
MGHAFCDSPLFMTSSDTNRCQYQREMNGLIWQCFNEKATSLSRACPVDLLEIEYQIFQLWAYMF